MFIRTIWKYLIFYFCASRRLNFLITKFQISLSIEDLNNYDNFDIISQWIFYILNVNDLYILENKLSKHWPTPAPKPISCEKLFTILKNKHFQSFEFVVKINNF